MEARQIAAAVNQLFDTYRRSDGKEYSNQEVADTLGGAIHPSTISKIRNAQMADPRRNTLMLLCKFFGASPMVFFPELGPTEPREDPVVVALRSTSLEPDAQAKLVAFIKALERKYREEEP